MVTMGPPLNGNGWGGMVVPYGWNWWHGAIPQFNIAKESLLCYNL